MTHLVLDTNIVLDVLVFEEERCDPLRRALQQQRLRVYATQNMRAELVRVLDYPNIKKRREQRQRSISAVLSEYDQWVDWCEPAPKVAFTCKDPDDQCFLDLAAHHRCALISKDDAVLVMHKRMASVGVKVCAVWTESDAP